MGDFLLLDDDNFEKIVVIVKFPNNKTLEYFQDKIPTSNEIFNSKYILESIKENFNNDCNKLTDLIVLIKSNHKGKKYSFNFKNNTYLFLKDIDGFELDIDKEIEEAKKELGKKILEKLNKENESEYEGSYEKNLKKFKKNQLLILFTCILVTIIGGLIYLFEAHLGVSIAEGVVLWKKILYFVGIFDLLSFTNLIFRKIKFEDSGGYYY